MLILFASLSTSNNECYNELNKVDEVLNTGKMFRANRLEATRLTDYCGNKIVTLNMRKLIIHCVWLKVAKTRYSLHIAKKIFHPWSK